MELIELTGVSKRFGERRILQDACARLPMPGTAALVGPSGSGKTTLGRMLLSLDADYQGEIRGVPERCACVFQEDRLLIQLTAAQNVRAACPSASERRLAEGFGALGMADERDTPSSELSGGMRRRVCILRAVLSDAPFVVMDEPMKGLDARAAQQAARYIRRQMAGRGLLYITHSAEEIDWIGAECVLEIADMRLRPVD